jgi:hypothetical protein
MLVEILRFIYAQNLEQYLSRSMGIDGDLYDDEIETVSFSTVPRVSAGAAQQQL